VHCFFEFFFVEGTASVVVGNLELLTDARNTSGSTLCNSLLQVFDELGFCGILGNSGLGLLLLGCGTVAENVRSTV